MSVIPVGLYISSNANEMQLNKLLLEDTVCENSGDLTA